MVTLNVQWESQAITFRSEFITDFVYFEELVVVIGVGLVVLAMFCQV